MKKYLFTSGDINGIGPEIVIKTLNEIGNLRQYKFYFACSPTVFYQTCKKIKPKFKFSFSEKYNPDSPTPVTILKLKNYKISLGKPTMSSGKSAYDSIKLAVHLAIEKQIDAIVTAPISKIALNKAGIEFPGHTEMLAEWTKSKNFVMTFLSKKMLAALLTIHEPVKNISRLITTKKIHSVLDVITNSLKIDLDIPQPKIAILGLNPHAGEDGLIGNEEKDIIIPTLKSYAGNVLIEGPFSPDAFFANRLYKNYDLVLGMYHDQVLIPFKYMNFGVGVNYTAGLPIIRTSPDHGVAYDIAGKGIADSSSMLEAFRYANKIVNNRHKNA